MFNVTRRFLRHRYFVIMNNHQDISQNEPIKLLRRLKIVHSYSSNLINNTGISQRRSTMPSHNNNNAAKMIRFNQSAVQKVASPSILSNKFTISPLDNSLLTTNKKNNQDSNKNNNSSKHQTIVGVSKINHRSFSTLGRFLSTPSDINSREFLSEISHGILTNKIKRIVVMAGAGISCPSGIPDFRTPGTGLYDNLRQYKIPYPEAIFDIDYFMKNPKPFFTLAKDLFPTGKYRPNKVHYFFNLLLQKKLLLRVYTQNIDGLERLAGVTDSYLVEAHGTFASATCIRCGEFYGGDYVKKSIDQYDICHCLKCKGVVKPDIVFFGEDLPSRFQLHSSDFRQADLLLVMGTSLEVEPFASIVDSTRFDVPRILLNREPVGVFRSKRRISDNCMLGDIVDSIDRIVKELRWEADLDGVIESGEKNKISFLDTISKVKPVTNARNFSTYTNVRRSRPAMLPPVLIRSNHRRTATDWRDSSSSSSSEESSSDTDSSST